MSGRRSIACSALQSHSVARCDPRRAQDFGGERGHLNPATSEATSTAQLRFAKRTSTRHGCNSRREWEVLYAQNFESPNIPPGFTDTAGNDVSLQAGNDPLAGRI